MISHLFYSSHAIVFSGTGKINLFYLGKINLNLWFINRWCQMLFAIKYYTNSEEAGIEKTDYCSAHYLALTTWVQGARNCFWESVQVSRERVQAHTLLMWFAYILSSICIQNQGQECKSEIEWSWSQVLSIATEMPGGPSELGSRSWQSFPPWRKS